MAGELTDARAILEDLVAAKPDAPGYVGWLGIVRARLGDRAAARDLLPSLERLSDRPFVTGLHTAYRAAILAELGADPHRVRGLMERSYLEGRSLSAFHFTPLFDPVRDHPSVRRFLRNRG